MKLFNLTLWLQLYMTVHVYAAAHEKDQPGTMLRKRRAAEVLFTGRSGGGADEKVERVEEVNAIQEMLEKRAFKSKEEAAEYEALFLTMNNSMSYAYSSSAPSEFLPQLGRTVTPSIYTSSPPSISDYPSSSPSVSLAPSVSLEPSGVPSLEPSSTPTVSFEPSGTPSTMPSSTPTVSFEPSGAPTSIPTAPPTMSSQPSGVPTAPPSLSPSGIPTIPESLKPSAQPSNVPTVTMVPTSSPTVSYAPSISQEPTISRSPSTSLSPSSAPSGSFAPTEKVNVGIGRGSGYKEALEKLGLKVREPENTI